MSQGGPPSFYAPQVQPLPLTDPALPFPSLYPREAIRAMIAELSQVQTQWEHDPQFVAGLTGKGYMAWLELWVLSVRALGWDEERVRQDPVNPTILDYNLCGQRIITVTCKALSMDRRIASFDILERVRWTQRSALAYQLRLQSQLAIADYGDVRYLGRQEIDNREVDVSVLDLNFAIALNAPEPGADPSTINTVDGGTQAPGTPITIPGTVSGATGVFVPTPPAPGGGLQSPDDSALGGTGGIGDNATLGDD
jgi:hypothetical protein